MIDRIEDGTFVLTGIMAVSGTGASPSCPVCTKMGTAHRYMQEVVYEKRHYFMCTPRGCGTAFPADWTPELVEALAQKRLECLRARGNS